MSKIASLLTLSIVIGLPGTLCLAGQAESTSTGESIYKVIYTGRLFGYFRFPGLQTETDFGCPAAPRPKEVEQFETQLRLARGGDGAPSLLVAVGDSFAPFVLSRIMWDAEGFQTWKNGDVSVDTKILHKDEMQYIPGRQHTHDQWLSGDEVAGKVKDEIAGQPRDRPVSDAMNLTLAGKADLPSDNVACFLQLENFDAITPGPHDFYYGPERLRQLEKFLRDSHGTSYPGVRVLSANLSLQTKYVDPNNPGQEDSAKPSSSKGAGSKPTSSTDRERPEIVIPKVVLPWIRRVIVKNAVAASGTTELSGENDVGAGQLPPDPVLTVCIIDLAGGSVERQAQDEKLCEKLASDKLTAEKVTKLLAQPAGPSADREYALPDDFFLKAGARYLIVAETARGSSVTKETGLVQYPFFEFPESDVHLMRQPWAFRQGDAKTPGGIAIFGVVDKDFAQSVGKPNDTWISLPAIDPTLPLKGKLDKLHRFSETVVESADPLESLDQVLQYCRTDKNCWGARKVLLASMSQQKAYDLLGQLRSKYKLPANATFDLVVASADPDRASGDEIVSKSASASAKDPYQRVTPVVLVPGAHFASNDPYTVRVRLQAASITVANFLPSAGSPAQAPPNEIAPNPPGERQFLTGFSKAQYSLVNRVFLADQPITVDPFEEPALQPLRSPSRNAPAGYQTLEYYLGVGAGAASTPQTGELPLPTPPSKARYTLVNRVLSVDQPIKADLFGESGLRLLRSASQYAPPASSPSSPLLYPLIEAALRTMREECHADAAAIQELDIVFHSSFLYSSIPPGLVYRFNQDGIRLLLEKIVWKGDFTQCTNIAGATINKTLTESASFKQQQNSGGATDLAWGLSLATVGMDEKQSDDSKRLVGAQFLDPRRLYAVAAANYLVYGDTSYSDLAAAEAPPVEPPSEQYLRPLARSITDLLLVQRLTSGSKLPMYWFWDALTLTQPPPHVERGLKDWVKGFTAPDGFYALPAEERDAQQRHVWYVSLYKADASYSLFEHNGTEASIGSRFPGLGVVDVTQADSAALAFDYLLRLTRSSRRWDFYTQSELNYGTKDQRQAGGAYTRSQTANFTEQDVGIALHLQPGYLSPRGLKLQLPVAVQTQVRDPFISVPLPPTGGSSTSSAQQIAGKHNIYLAMKPGLRYDYIFPRPVPAGQVAGSGGPSASGAAGAASAAAASTASKNATGLDQGQNATLNSYLELGYETGEILKGIQALQFTAPGQTPRTCDVAQDFNACVTNYLALLHGTKPVVTSVAGRQHFQDGLYLNFRFDLPIRSNLEYVVEHRGDYFFGSAGDSPLDMHFYSDLKSQLLFSLFNKIKVSPTVELVLFENKIRPSLYRSVNTYLSLNYSFDWHQGLNIEKVLRYNNPVPPLPYLPTR
jgi:hypothetical protein